MMLEQKAIDALIQELSLPQCFADKLKNNSQLQFYVTMARSNPTWVAKIIQQHCPDDIASNHSLAELALNFTKAMSKWVSSGFEYTSEAEFQQRWAACKACPHLVEPPTTGKYAFINKFTSKEDKRICGACGCNAMGKAKLKTEKCPVASEQDDSINRWNQQILSKDSN